MKTQYENFFEPEMYTYTERNSDGRMRNYFPETEGNSVFVFVFLFFVFVLFCFCFCFCFFLKISEGTHEIEYMS